jgi:hypothetical protein
MLAPSSSLHAQLGLGNPLLDHLVGDGEQPGREGEAERRLGNLQVEMNSNLVDCTIGKSAGFPAFTKPLPIDNFCMNVIKR